MPACANVFGVQISANVPPPPWVTHKLGYCESHRLCRSGSAVWLLLYGFVPLPCPPRNLTSSISELSPADHRTPTARGFTPPVNTPSPVRILVPPSGASRTALGEPTP